MSSDFPFVIRGKVCVVFSQISSSGGRRKEKNPNEARGTYIWMNLLKTPLAKATLRIMKKMEHLTKDEFHNYHYKHITNAIFDERSA